MKPLRLALGLLFAANGLWMLLAARHWYGVVPGVMDSGPFSAHFVRDIGAAYVLCGLAFVALAHDAAARPYALAGCAFLLAHGALHVAETLLGLHGFGHLLVDLPAVLLLPWLALWSARH